MIDKDDLHPEPMTPRQHWVLMIVFFVVVFVVAYIVGMLL
jgi:hypothetical protein